MKKKIYCKQKQSYMQKRFSTDDGNKKYHKVRDHCNHRKI